MNLYDEASFELMYTYEGDDLGAHYTPGQTTWKLWSPMAKDLELILYTTGSDEEVGSGIIGTYPMVRQDKGVWALTLKGNYENVYYTYNIRLEQHLKETADPYSYGCGINGERSMVVNHRATDPEGWDQDQRVVLKQATDAVIWEVHVKDFSSDPDSGMKHKGKYLAFTEQDTCVPGHPELPTGISYLKQLGITHVHLLPISDFATVDEAHPEKNEFNWGYDPLHYNVPEGSYATDPWHGEVRIRETKQMIQALHQAGIGVILDVVYNHTYYTERSWFQRVFPGYYHRQSADGRFSNGSGCGNEIASERSMVRRYILQSLKYWAEEYHVDGFRFDLMGVLDVKTMNEARQMLDQLPGGRSILMYGEPWAAAPIAMRADEMPADKTHVRYLDPRIAIFNDDTRDSIKGSAFQKEKPGFVNGATDQNWRVQNSMKGWCGPLKTVKVPTQTISYCSAHDNYTLWDKLIETVDVAHQDYDEVNKKRLAVSKMTALILFTSQGIPFFQAGEEFARTKRGDHNSYRSEIGINQLDWKRTGTFSELQKYYEGLIALRKQISAFRESTEHGAWSMYFSYTPNQVVAYTIPGKVEDPWKQIAVVVNSSAAVTEAELETWSDAALPDHWMILADERGIYPEGKGSIQGNRIRLEPRTALILGGR